MTKKIAVGPFDEFGHFALETFPPHFALARMPLAEFDFVDTHQIIPSTLETTSLSFWHRRRLAHSCRILNLPAPTELLWRELAELRKYLHAPGNILEAEIFSLRYFGCKAALATWLSGPAAPAAAAIAHRGENYLLLRRPNPYTFPHAFSHAFSGSGFCYLGRVGVAPELRNELPNGRNRLWRAKCQAQVALSERLGRWRHANPELASCDDLLIFTQQREGQSPMLLEGCKTNVFLLFWNRQARRLHLHTPRCTSRHFLHSGTTRNWLCHNYKRVPGLELLQRDISLEDMLSADGLLLCNAAMGLRLVRELKLPTRVNAFYTANFTNLNGQLRHFNLGGQTMMDPFAAAFKILRQLLCLYWNTQF